MAAALVSVIIDQLASILRQQIEAEVQLVVGVKDEVQKLAGNFQAIQAVLEDAEKRQFNEAAVSVWFDKLKDASYDIDDVLDEWSTAIRKHQIQGVDNAPAPKKVCSFFSSPCHCFGQVSLRRDIVIKIKELVERLDVIAKERQTYNFESSEKEPERPISTSLIDVLEVKGRASDKKVIIDQLLRENSPEEKSFHIISIVGLGGIGKTTLAQLAYNDDDVKTHFEKKIWVCVSDPFDEVKIAKAILQELQGSSPATNELNALHNQIHDLVRGKKFLLVLDDVWTEDNSKWDRLKLSLMSGTKASKVLVTTRSERIAKLMGTTHTHNLKELSERDCWSLFEHIAFYGRSMEERENVKEIGKKLVKKCNGLPLAAKTLGSLMRLKDSKEEWQTVLDSEVWKLEEVVGKKLYAPLLLSYYDLPPKMKKLFSYCAVFPKDSWLERDDLVQLWMAQGYLDSEENSNMEIKGREYFKNLAMRSFFQDFGMDKVDGSIIRCKMHDMVHDLAQLLTQKECIVMENDNANKQGKESSSIQARHASITGHLSSSLSFPNTKNLRTLLFLSSRVDLGVIDLCNNLICLRALDMRGCSLIQIPREVGKLIHLRYLNLSFNYGLKELPKEVCELCNLQTLDISRCGVREIPREVGKLIHLRYLNLSGNRDLKELPEEVCELCNLQTLSLNWCVNIERLPQGIGKLISLRHLELEDTYRLKVLPKGIGRLSCLRRLSKFIVSDDCKIGELRSLNHLQGNLEIHGLEKVTEVNEVERAELKNKKELRELTLCFNQNVMDYEPLEVLQPPSQLEQLHIWGYSGTTLSTNWITFSLNLKSLHLESFENCKCLLHLGRLLFLEKLTIGCMGSVKRVGVEFLGIEKQERPFISFPKLKELNFLFMREWEEWKWITITSADMKDEIPIIMPCLRSFTLDRCPKLKALPDHFLQNRSFNGVKITMCPFVEKQLQDMDVEYSSNTYS